MVTFMDLSNHSLITVKYLKEICFKHSLLLNHRHFRSKHASHTQKRGRFFVVTEDKNYRLIKISFKLTPSQFELNTCMHVFKLTNQCSILDKYYEIRIAL